MKPVKLKSEIFIPITDEVFSVVSDKIKLSRPFGIVCISQKEEGIDVTSALGLCSEIYSEMFFILHGFDKKEFPPKPVRLYNSIDVPATEDVIGRVSGILDFTRIFGTPYEELEGSDIVILYEDGYVSYVVDELYDMIGKTNEAS